MVISAAPIGPQNSYEVVRGFNSDFFSTAVEEVIGEGGEWWPRVDHQSKWSDMHVNDPSHDL